VFGEAIAGLATGATTRPIIARILSRRPMVDRLIIVSGYHTGPGLIAMGTVPSDRMESMNFAFCHFPDRALI
jgi:hypothetical protein